jgi:hypothetical protein
MSGGLVTRGRHIALHALLARRVNGVPKRRASALVRACRRSKGKGTRSARSAGGARACCVRSSTRRSDEKKNASGRTALAPRAAHARPLGARTGVATVWQRYARAEARVEQQQRQQEREERACSGAAAVPRAVVCSHGAARRAPLAR